MEVLTPIKAIRAHCIDCCCGNKVEVRLCSIEKCHLHPYRMGHRPRGSNYTTPEGFSEKSEASPMVQSGEDD
jgi:hypothetical protein